MLTSRASRTLHSDRRAHARATGAGRAPARCQYRQGQRLRHSRWGEGVVVASRLTEGDEVVTIAFRKPDVGRKQLIASLAQLETLA